MLAAAALLLPATALVLLPLLLQLLPRDMARMLLFAIKAPVALHAAHLTRVELAAGGPAAGGADWQQQLPCDPAEGVAAT